MKEKEQDQPHLTENEAVIVLLYNKENGAIDMNMEGNLTGLEALGVLTLAKDMIINGHNSEDGENPDQVNFMGKGGQA